MRTYSGALSQVKDQTLVVKPLRANPDDTEVIVRSEVKGKATRSSSTTAWPSRAMCWKIHDVNVLGVWLVETYRASFAQEISASGIDGLIAKLAEKNKAAAAAKS